VASAAGRTACALHEPESGPPVVAGVLMRAVRRCGSQLLLVFPRRGTLQGRKRIVYTNTTKCQCQKKNSIGGHCLQTTSQVIKTGGYRTSDFGTATCDFLRLRKQRNPYTPASRAPCVLKSRHRKGLTGFFRRKKNAGHKVASSGR